MLKISSYCSKKKKWNIREDQRLRMLVDIEYGVKGKVKWSLLSNFMRGRTGKQCRERWHNHLSPSLSASEPWTSFDRDILENLVSRYGTKWALIQRSNRRFFMRSQNFLKNKFNAVTAARKRKRKKSVDSKEHIHKIKKNLGVLLIASKLV